MPAIEIGALLDATPLNYAAFAEELQATAVCPSDEFINKSYVNDAHARGLEVYVWTINDPEEVERMSMRASMVFLPTFLTLPASQLSQLR